MKASQGDSACIDEYGPEVSSIEARLESVRERIARTAARAGRDPSSVVLVGITKGRSALQIREAMRAGLEEIGENRVQEALPKIAAVGSGARWHMVGHLQRNKARAAAGAFDVIHSIDSLRLGEAVGRAAHESGRSVRALIQVNVSREPTKHGIAPGLVPALARGMMGVQGLELVGLMTLAPAADDPESARPVFRALRTLRDEIRSREGGAGVRELSMGMSDDFEVAIEEGATMVRIGRLIFEGGL